MFFLHFTEYLLRHNLQHLIVHVTNHCNFRCQHCFIDFSPKNDLSLERYRELGRKAGKLFWLDVGGGEPYLRRDLVEIILSFQSRVVQIPTNGSLQDRVVEMTKDLRRRYSGDITISLSIDGLETTHDAIRKAKGNWNQVWSSFSELRKIDGLSLKINTVLHKDNAAELIPLMEEVRSREPDFHSIILLRGTPLNPEYGLPPIDELHRLAPKIFEILGTYDYGKGGLTARILRNYHRYLWNTSLETIRRKTQVVPCAAGRAHMVVLGNGDVSSCEMLPPVGNLNEQGLDEITSGRRFVRQVDDIKDKKCFCTHNCAMLDSIMFRPASIPQLLHQKIDGMA